MDLFWGFYLFVRQYDEKAKKDVPNQFKPDYMENLADFVNARNSKLYVCFIFYLQRPPFCVRFVKFKRFKY